MHTGILFRIAADRAGRFLVTTSSDRTARVWDLATGNLLRILRPPISTHNDGQLYAVALSPDGQTVALGGWTGADWDTTDSVYLFDVTTGALTRRLTGFADSISALEYSRDGSLLAVGMSLGGVRVFRPADEKPLMEDAAYADAVLSVDFDSRGRMVASSEDGDLRLYDENLNLSTRRTMKGGKQPSSARFSPDGTSIAVGFIDAPVVTVVDAATLEPSFTPDLDGITPGNLAFLTWSSGGDRLCAGGTVRAGLGRSLFCWSQAGRGARTVARAGSGSIEDVRALSTGEVVVASSDPRWAVIDASGTVRLERSSPVFDYRGNNATLRAWSDGVRFAFLVPAGDDAVAKFAEFDVSKLTLTREPSVATAAAPPRVTGLPIERWEDNVPLLRGKPLPLSSHEIVHSLVVWPDASRFLVGADWSLYLFANDGKLAWKTPTQPIWGVNLTPDGRFAVTVQGDGTIRWYSTDDGRESLAVLPLPDGKRWIAWTPEGFYAAAPGAETLAGFHLNQGVAHAGDFVALGQLADLFHRPDLVAGALDPDGLKRIQTTLAHMGDARELLKQGLPPSVKIARVHYEGDKVVIQAELTDRGGGIGRPTFRINGVVQEARSVVPSIPGQKTVTVRAKFRLPAGASRISVTGSTRGGQVESEPTDVPVKIGGVDRRPTLHVLAVGVTHYLDGSLDLKHASADAVAVTKEFMAHGRKLFERVNIPQPLVDRDVTYANLKKRFDEMAPQVKPNDVFVFYVAGHGEVRDGRYLFIPANLVYTNSATLIKDAIDEDKLQALLAKIPAQKSLVLFDTCSAGTLAHGQMFASRSMDQKGALDRLMAATGRAFLAAAGNGEAALEGYQGHGVFTAALLEGLNRADLNKDGFVDINELDTFVRSEVPRITERVFHQKQFPMSTVTLHGEAFPIAAISK
jgi:WD40 repeat protein